MQPEDVRKHLELIQGVVNRLAGNSSALKGWAVTLVAALFALAAKDARKELALIGYLPTVMFWILDGYYLRQERLFRKLYDSVAGDGLNAAKPYSMDTSTVDHEVDGWLAGSGSPTLLLFYVPLAVSIAIAFTAMLLWSHP